MNEQRDPNDCTRCRGKGYGDWVVQHGICYGCNGKGTREAQRAVQQVRRDFNSGKTRRDAEARIASVLINADSRREATAILMSGFRLEGIVPAATTLAPGWYVYTVHGGALTSLEAFDNAAALPETGYAA